MVRNFLLALTLMTGLTLPLTGAQARTFRTIPDLHIVSVEVTVDGWIGVRFDVASFDCSNEGGPSNAPALYLSLTELPLGEGAFDRIYSGLLAAQFAGRPGNFRITGSNDGTVCVIERVFFK